MNYQNTLKIVTNLLIEVGDYQVEKFNSRDFSQSVKSTEIDVVTEVDKKSEDMIIQGLKKHFEGHGFLAEESDQVITESDYTWVIDPLDGTTNFSTGIPIFAISVALENKGQSVLGAVYIPLQKTMYTAIKDHGAYKNEQAIEVNHIESLRQAVIATGFPYDRAENPINNVSEFSAIVTEVKGIRRLGVAAYDLCLVAEGVFAGYWEYGLKPWDYAAGLLIALEAGGVYHPLAQRDHSMIVSNPLIFKALKNKLGHL